MRCLGRTVLLLVLLVAGGGAWLYRDDLSRWFNHQVHPATARLRVGHPSPAALRSAMRALDALEQGSRDSVVLNSNQTASLLAHGVNFLPGVTLDSLTVEPGEGEIRIHTVLDSARVPARLRELIPGHLQPFQSLDGRGTLVPVRPGLAELQLQHVSLHGIPLPSDLIARMAAEATGRGRDGRIELPLPPGIGGFRIRPDGMTVYRQGRP